MNMWEISVLFFPVLLLAQYLQMLAGLVGEDEVGLEDGVHFVPQQFLLDYPYV